MDTDKQFCSIIFDILQAKGVKDVVCSPGSRNVPLLIAAASRDSFSKHFVVDERSAAFLALGMSMVAQSPVVLVCTSGTALLNYSPAIAEAYYHNLPLIVLSADRPIQWIDQDDSQTLRQDGALDNYVKKSYSVPAFGNEDKELQWYVNRIVNDAYLTATTGRQGPVHINIHLGEPLSGKRNKTEWDHRIIHTITGDSIGNKETIKELAKRIEGRRTMVVAGFNSPDAQLQKAISEFSRFPNVTIMAETISNLHLSRDFYSIDSVLTAFPEERLDDLSPEIVISLGGSLVSRKLKEYLRRNVDKIEHWNVGYTHTTSDPFLSLSLKIETEPSRFFRNLNSSLRKLVINRRAGLYSKEWEILRGKGGKIKKDFIAESGWSELKAFDLILNSVPSSYNLFLSNGTTIRYAQLIPYKLPHSSYCNRGVSGIDGTLATAIGGGLKYKGNTLLVSGDLSLSYDISSLGMNNIPETFKIIVIDNQGGGIFRFIPSTSHMENLEEYLCQPPNLPLRALADGYGWQYLECSDENGLKDSLKEFFEIKGKTILNVRCDGKKSAEILRNYMELKIK